MPDPADPFDDPADDEPDDDDLVDDDEADQSDRDDIVELLDSDAVDLSARERQVIKLLAAGRADTTIAETLGIQPRTTKQLISRLAAKLTAAAPDMPPVTADDVRAAAKGRRPRRDRSPTHPTPLDRRIANAVLELMGEQRYSYRTFAEAVDTGRAGEIWSKSRMQRQIRHQRFTIVDLLDFLRTLNEPPERFFARPDVGIIHPADDLESRVRYDAILGLNEGDRDSIQAIIDRAKRRPPRDVQAS